MLGSGPAEPALTRQPVLVTTVTNINDVLDGHVTLEVECVDRMLLNAYVPNLQVGGQVVRFLTEHLGFPIPSPTLFNTIGNRFRRDVKHFAEDHEIPLLHLKKPDRSRWDDRKVDHVRPYVDAAEAAGRFGVVAMPRCAAPLTARRSRRAESGDPANSSPGRRSRGRIAPWLTPPRVIRPP